MKCKFKKTCDRYKTSECNDECFAYVVLHGTDGTKGYYGNTRVPKRYQDCDVENLPIQKDNPKAFEIITKYASEPLKYVLDKRLGLFLFSIPNKDNPLGTGTGKTTSAITILNEYLIARVKQFLQDNFNMKDNPVMFIKLSELQNTYNSQFRGGLELQKQGSYKYYNLLNRMKTTELLVVDDVGIRDLTEPFKNEIYDLIDTRVTEELPTIYTSNYPLAKLNDFLGERIVSRIDGQCYQVGFVGKDNRKGGLF